MFKAIVLIATILVACNGNPIPEAKDGRIGNFNSYYFYPKERPIHPIPITSFADIDATSFDPTLTTAIVIHGVGATSFTSFSLMVRDALFTNHKNEDVNVIVVDWSVFAGQSYANAVLAVPRVGIHVAQFIDQVLGGYSDFSLSKLHLVGFNLGAHVCGNAGRQLRGAVARITALDPSGNQWGSNSQRLTRHDAEYVEVIHTDGRGVLANGIGTSIGDVDFYPNGGTLQPGCLNNECYHNRAYELFAASLTHGNLIGNLCATELQMTTNTCRGQTLEMGTNDLFKFGSGMYRVNTRNTYPF